MPSSDAVPSSDAEQQELKLVSETVKDVNEIAATLPQAPEPHVEQSVLSSLPIADAIA